jgi:predicted PurR-regulated permease PerM
MEIKEDQSSQKVDSSHEENSPYWGTTTKLVVGIALVALAAGIFMQMRPILTPVTMALVVVYLLFPLVEWLSEHTILSWRGAANLTFIILLLLLLSSLTASGVALVNQFSNLIDIVESFLQDLPTIVEDFINSDPVIVIPIIGYQIDVAEYISSFNIDLLAISEQALSVVQPVLGQAGGVLTRVATSAVGVLGWGGFILAVAYMITTEARQGRKFLKRELAGMTADIGRMTRELGYLWNTFLRGQMLVFLMASTTMFILMSILGVRYALGLAILSGFARFIPYVGQVFSTIVNALVGFFLAEGNYLGLDPLPYMLLVVILAFLHDQTYDSLVIPRLIGYVLGVHPALVLITALVLTSWIGVLGVILAAPILASFQLIASYLIRKMMDQDPWPDEEVVPPTLAEQVGSILKTVWSTIKKGKDIFVGFIQKLIARFKKS